MVGAVRALAVEQAAGGHSLLIGHLICGPRVMVVRRDPRCALPARRLHVAAGALGRLRVVQVLCLLQLLLLLLVHDEVRLLLRIDAHLRLAARLGTAPGQIEARPSRRAVRLAGRSEPGAERRGRLIGWIGELEEVALYSALEHLSLE